jgi:hypothetical protein
MYCPNCRAEGLDDELFCRYCGTELEEPSTSLVPIHSYLPAVLQNPQLPRVAAGVGAVVVGVGLELLRRSLLTRLTRSQAVENALPTLTGIKDILLPEPAKTTKLPKGYEVHETVIYMRRVIRRER